MAIEKIDCTFDVLNGDTISITPSNNITIQDNSTYSIKITGLKSLDGTKSLPTTQIKITTAVSPMYCTLASLNALVKSFGIPETDLLSYIRDASKYADFISGNSTTTSSDTTTEFAKEQFTRTKATLDAILRGVIDQSYSGSSGKYTLDVASIEESASTSTLKDLLDLLRGNLKEWQDAIRGYYNEGRAAPVATRIGLKASSNSEVTHTTVDMILNDFTRTMPESS